jgi:hypothetical protein
MYFQLTASQHSQWHILCSSQGIGNADVIEQGTGAIGECVLILAGLLRR